MSPLWDSFPLPDPLLCVGKTLTKEGEKKGQNETQFSAHLDQPGVSPGSDTVAGTGLPEDAETQPVLIFPLLATNQCFSISPAVTQYLFFSNLPRMFYSSLSVH